MSIIDSLLGLRLIPHVKAKVVEWEQDSKSISILVTGKTGTGKSTLINLIVGREVAKPGHDLHPETSIVEPYTLTEGDTVINIYDSPGLQDGTLDEARYLAEMKRKCSNVDLIIYCIQMSETRVLDGGPDMMAMKRLNETFGHELWKNMIFLLTFANDIVYKAKLKHDKPEDQLIYFDKELQEWDSLLRACLESTIGVPKEIVDGIVITPAGHKNQPIIPDPSCMVGQSHWLSRVWLKALGCTKPRAQLALIKLNLHRIQTHSEQYEHDGDIEGELIIQHRLVFQEKGVEIGKALGIPAGEFVGEVAGFFAGMDSFIDSLVLQLMIKACIISHEEVFPDKSLIDK